MTMRSDVLYLILGWTLIALALPLAACGLITGWLDSVELALKAFALPAFISSFVGIVMLSFGTRTNTSERLRDKKPLPVWRSCGRLLFQLVPSHFG